MKISRHEIRLVQKYWFAVANDTQFLSAEFYTELFSRFPHYQKYFKSDAKSLSERLMMMINIIINGVEFWEKIEPEIVQLGKRHAEIADFTRQDYYNIVNVLIDVLTRSGPDIDRETLTAWHNLFDIVSETMLSGVQSAEPGELTD